MVRSENLLVRTSRLLKGLMAILAFLASIFARPLVAQLRSGTAISPTISYQGSIASAGQVVPDGSYDISVRLYGDSIGADTIWQGPYTTMVQGGVFSILLGSGNTPLPTSAAMDRQLWVGVQINNGEELRPLSQLAATPYALNVSDNAITANKLASGSVTAEKVSFPYLGGLDVGGLRAGNPGDAINLLGAGGIQLTYDSLARSITFNDEIMQGGTLSAANGGTGQSTYAIGDILYASSSSQLSRLPVGSSNQVLGISEGRPSWTQNSATITIAVNSPAALNSTPVNDYVVDGSSTYIRLNNTSGRSINLMGLSSAGVANGRVITLVNTSTIAIIIKHRNSGSERVNQFDLPGGADILLGQSGAVTFVYDAMRHYWELLSSNH
jgi:hypothetical protein